MSNADIYELALADPAAVYDKPHDVLKDSRLSEAQKEKVLSCWAYDCAQLAVADDEGMTSHDWGSVGNGEWADLSSVMRALNELASPDGLTSAIARKAIEPIED